MLFSDRTFPENEDRPNPSKKTKAKTDNILSCLHKRTSTQKPDKPTSQDQTSGNKPFRTKNLRKGEPERDEVGRTARKTDARHRSSQRGRPAWNLELNPKVVTTEATPTNPDSDETALDLLGSWRPRRRAKKNNHHHSQVHCVAGYNGPGHPASLPSAPSPRRLPAGDGRGATAQMECLQRPGPLQRPTLERNVTCKRQSKAGKKKNTKKTARTGRTENTPGEGDH